MEVRLQRMELISIHAPARGATAFVDICLAILKFQSTLPRGERQPERPNWKRQSGFQSTLPRGERPNTHLSASGTEIYFNPRSREGSDSVGCTVQSRHQRISIHAPARGATYHPFFSNSPFFNSIHARAWGATYNLYPENDSINISIHAPARGATHWRV